MAQPFSSAGRTSNTKINYKVVGGVAQPTYDQSSIANTKNQNNSVPLWKIDMGREAHFTVEIEGITKPNMKYSYSKTDYGNFLPIKSFAYTPVTVEHLSLTAGLFTDIPIPQYRKVGKIELSVQDTTDHFYENQFYEWYYKTVPDDLGCVGYLADTVRKFSYRQYNNKGELNATYFLEVLPDGGVQIDRTYENDGLKVVKISLVIVGIIDVVYSGTKGVGKDAYVSGISYGPEE